MSPKVTRRGFIKGAAAVAGLTVLGGPFRTSAYAANAKLNIALVGVGGQAGAGHASAMAENCVAMCDADPSRWTKLASARPNTPTYTDWRKMYDAHKDINVVYVATPDHTHFPASYTAVMRGWGVYCEKPLTHGIWEARTLADAVREKKVPTQMGNQGHSGGGIRRIVEWIRAGAIGDVVETHTWTGRPSWPQGMGRPADTPPVPEGLDWDAWIGVAPMRPYNPAYHPFKWRGYYDFGCGAIGDMGCHTWDGVWWSLDPKFPLTAECIKAESRNDETYPRRMIVKWTFGPSADGKRPGFSSFWYEGGLKPDTPEEITADGGKMPGSGSLFIGTKGKLLSQGDYCDSARLIPNSAMEEFKTHLPPQMPKSIGHREELLAACRGDKPWDYPLSNFTYAGPLVEALNLANLSMRLDKKLEWDPVNLKCKGLPEADPYIRRAYRKGWVDV
jgi:predicted dehydrogenase